MDIRKAFATDKRAETEGRKLYLDKAKDIWLLIARKGNTLYKAYLSKMLTENSALLNTKTPEAEVMANAIFKEAAARHLLIGWSPKGIDLGEVLAVNEDGTPKMGEDGKQVVLKPHRKDVPYGFEPAMELMLLDDFDTLVSNFSGEMANYRAEEVAKEAKNSKTA